MNVATPIPLKEGMTLCEAITSHFSKKNVKPFLAFCERCSKDEKKFLEMNARIKWENGEQNLILVKPTFEDCAIDDPQTKLSIGSNAIIMEDKFQCIGCVILDSDNKYSLYVKRLGTWYLLQVMEKPVFQFHTYEPKNALMYLFMKDVPDYVK